jgi:acyl-CoA hydrolase
MTAVPMAASAADAVLDHIGPGTHLVVPLANGEPPALLDAVEASASQLEGVRVHQMHTLANRGYLDGRYGEHLRHVSYFLSPSTRRAFAAGGCDMVPANFSEVPNLLARLDDPLVLASASMPDNHGYVSLGTNADYVASMIGKARFFVECNPRMPRTFGRNQLHLSQLAGWFVNESELIEAPPIVPTDADRRIGQYIAERIPNGATVQAGIGGIPNAVMESLADHRDLGVHTELLSDGLIDLIEAGVINGINKRLNRTKVVATFALGTRRLYDFIDTNPVIELWPVRYVNNPRIIGDEPGFVSINATLEVDFLGQAASESIGSQLYSGSGGQADFARGAMFSTDGQGFIVLRSTAQDDTVSRIVPQLTVGAAVTTIKNTVDKIVTEYGVAELRGKTVAERTRSLIAIAHPKFRDELEARAKEMGFLR